MALARCALSLPATITWSRQHITSVKWVFEKRHNIRQNSSVHRGFPYLGTFGPRFHDEAEDTVASATYGKTTQKLVLE